MIEQTFSVTSGPFEQANAASDAYRALLAVSEAIVAHHDLSALFHELAGRLHPVVRFDHLALSLHEAARNTLRVHVLEPAVSTADSVANIGYAVRESPAGTVWQTQQPLVLANATEMRRWPPRSIRSINPCWRLSYGAKRRIVPRRHGPCL
jgi:formate hydrogenlyase transcriptional activator